MRATRVSYVAATWAFVFASASFYWALGGRTGLETIGPGLTAFANDPWFVAIGLWGVGVAKVAGGLLALALIRLRQRRRVHRLWDPWWGHRRRAVCRRSTPLARPVKAGAISSRTPSSRADMRPQISAIVGRDRMDQREVERRERPWRTTFG